MAQSKATHSLHCVLNHHHHPQKFCPHTAHAHRSPVTQISADCGGDPAGTLPAQPPRGQFNLLLENFFHLKESPEATRFQTASSFAVSRSGDPESPPPKAS